MKEWEITFKVDGLTTNSTNSTNSTYLTQFSGSEIKVSGNKASTEDENLRIDYTNDKEGMRQDFICNRFISWYADFRSFSEPDKEDKSTKSFVELLDLTLWDYFWKRLITNKKTRI